MNDLGAVRLRRARNRKFKTKLLRTLAAVPEQSLREVLDCLPAGAYTCNREGLITYYNSRAREGWGRAPQLMDPEERFCGSFRMFTAEGKPMPHDRCWMALALAEGREQLGRELIVERPDGRRCRVLAHATPLRDANGQVTGALNIFVDVTDVRRTEERLRFLLESIDDHFVQYDREWRYTFVTEKGAAMIGKTPQELLGKSIWELFPDAVGNDYYRRLQEAAATGQVVRFEHYYAPFGKWFDNHIYPTDEGITVFSADITERKRAEGARARLAAIVESSNDAILGKDLDGVVTSWNAGAQRLYGYTAEEMVGQPVLRLIPPERHGEERSNLARLRRGERIANFETERIRKDGSRVPVSLTLSPVRDGDGAIVGSSSVAHDISGRKQAERDIQEREERYRSLVHASGAIVFSSDAAARWHQPQPGWEKYTGQSFEQYRGYGWADAIHPEDRERITASVAEAVSAGRVWENEGRLWHAPSRSYRYQEVRAVPIRHADGTVREWVGTCVDIHARKVAEQALRDADRRKEEFLAVLAHELRNPLAPISTSLQLLRLPHGSEARQSVIDVMERQVHHLVRLVDDLLEVSRITRGTIELRKEVFPLAEAVRAAVEISRDLVDAHAHRLTVDLDGPPVLVNGDRVRLTQVIANLLNNAAKYTPHGGRIGVRLERAGGEALVKVTDSGIGIEPHLIERVFEMFAQTGRSIERSTGGLGIGLSLARRLAQLHGGTVEGHSAGEGRGSEFTVRLPVAPHAESVAPGTGSAPAAGAQPRRILVVDDNRDAATTLASLLRALGHDVAAAFDGDAALRQAEAAPPDVMLLDLGMPGMSGYTVARRVREAPWGRRVRLVAITGWGQETDRRRTVESGFDLHLVKPIGLPEVQRALS